MLEVAVRVESQSRIRRVGARIVMGRTDAARRLARTAEICLPELPP